MANLMNKIKHVVHVMFENRPFDTMLGWPYENKNTERVIGAQSPNGKPFEGLQTIDLENSETLLL
jgi:phospholipase C